MRAVRWRFWVELAVAVVSVFLVLLTLVWRDWIEEVFGVDPDHGRLAELAHRRGVRRGGNRVLAPARAASGVAPFRVALRTRPPSRVLRRR